MKTAFYRQNAPWLGAGAVLAVSSSFGQTYFISLFAGDIRGAFGLSDGQWGGLYTIATLASAALLVQGGRLADVMPLRRLMCWIVLGFAVACFAMGAAQSVPVLLAALFAIRFCGQGMMTHLSMTAMARWFRANRGRAVAVAIMGYPVGEAVLPPLTVWSITLIGWRGTWWLAACVLLLVVLPTLWRLMGQPRSPEGEGDGLMAAGMLARHWSRRDMLRHWSFWALLPGILATNFIGTCVFFQQVHVAQTQGWSLARMAAAYPLYAMVSVAAAFVAGHLVDRIGAVRLLPVYLLPMAVAMLILRQDGSEAIWIATLAIMGLTTGVSSTLYGTIWPTLYGTNAIGGIKAVIASCMVMATAIGPGLTGLAIDAGVPFTAQAPVLALWCVLASIAFWPISRRLARALP
ncbi:sugar phosphate permease [Rubricella aquisinus]|uniref:Sugar phosphate permease n=1 Tax=Rubricella aquisinus TaxID=2028108 RepID=A0A840WSS4_9RHOB|nr:MFS transporter [Rubricella aquisinus]MBB5514260.1 sugar phosphate permease [Rubricella aquisinus]